MTRARRTRLTSRQNPLVARFRAVARGDDPAWMLLDGVHLVEEAVASRVPVATVIAADEGDNPPGVALLDALEAAGAEVVAASPPVLAAASPLRSPSSICAIAARPSFAPDQLYAGDTLVVIACEIQDPGNFGAIVRVCEAAGATGVVAAGATADPFGWKALRGSMGSALRLPIIRMPESAAAAQIAREHGCQVVATVPRDGDPLFNTTLVGRIAILIGGEGAGLPEAALALSDRRVSIPMTPSVESLNAAMATGLIVYEARRQRRLLSQREFL